MNDESIVLSHRRQMTATADPFDGWPTGEYLVELFDTKTLEKVSEGSFTVK